MAKVADDAESVIILTESNETELTDENKEYEIVEVSGSENPWPHLNQFLSFIKSDGMNYVFKCDLCHPLNHEIRAHKSSYNNVKSHFKKKHPSALKDVDEACKASSQRGKKRKLVDSPESSISMKKIISPPRQLSMRESLKINAAGAGVPQANVDKAFVDLVVYGMYPLQIADCPWLRKFAQVLNPTKTIPSRRTLGRRIILSFNDKKEQLMR